LKAISLHILKRGWHDALPTNWELDHSYGCWRGPMINILLPTFPIPKPHQLTLLLYSCMPDLVNYRRLTYYLCETSFLARKATLVVMRMRACGTSLWSAQSISNGVRMHIFESQAVAFSHMGFLIDQAPFQLHFHRVQASFLGTLSLLDVDGFLYCPFYLSLPF